MAAHATTTVDYGSYKTTITDSTNNIVATVTTDTDEKRVTMVRVITSIPNPDPVGSNYSASAKKTLHDAVVTAIKNNMGLAI